jgi:hypothetical protein
MDNKTRVAKLKVVYDRLYEHCKSIPFECVNLCGNCVFNVDRDSCAKTYTWEVLSELLQDSRKNKKRAFYGH